MTVVLLRSVECQLMYRLHEIVFVVFWQFRAEAFIRSVQAANDKLPPTDGIKPSLLTRQRTSSSSLAAAAAPPSSYRRRSSVSVSSGRDSRQRPSPVSRSLSSSLPLPPTRASPALASSPVSAASVDVKSSRVSSNDLPTPAAIQAIFDVRVKLSR